MSKRENNRDQIIAVASENFMENGYQATSVRHIAQGVGVSDAAIYYHFKGGKRELLQQVIEVAVIDLKDAINYLLASVSLRDLVERYGRQMSVIRGGRIQKTIRWISSEMRHLSPEERDLFYRPLLRFHESLKQVIERYLSDPLKADQFAWLLICTGFGFRQIFFDMELEATHELDVTTLFTLIADGLPLS
ncbi:MAG: TetR/AcrR family transcriptional regulator [Chloroflexota bacterium]